MTFDEYQKLAERTMRFDRSRHDFPLQMHDLLMHALLGLPAEVGEVEGLASRRKIFQICHSLCSGSVESWKNGPEASTALRRRS